MRPVALIFLAAGRPARLPTSTMRPARTPMSAMRHGLPVPSTRRPPKMTRSNRCEKAAAANSRPRMTGRIPSSYFIALAICRDARDTLANDQCVDVLGALVSLDCLEVTHMAHDRVLVCYAIG